MSTTSVRFAGTGGQGLILAGLILAEAAAKSHGRNVVQTNSYGPEARGGASKSDVIISDEPIYNPKPESADVLLVMSQPAYDKYVKETAPGGFVLYDSSGVVPRGGANELGADVTGIAVREIQNEIVANVVALGVLVGAFSLVSEEAIEKAVLARVPSKAKDLNLKAVRRGIEEGRKLRTEVGRK